MLVFAIEIVPDALQPLLELYVALAAELYGELGARDALDAARCDQFHHFFLVDVDGARRPAATAAAAHEGVVGVGG